MKDRQASPDSTSSTLSCITVRTRFDTAARSSIGASPFFSTPPTSRGDSESIYNVTKVEGSGESQKPEQDQDQNQNAQRTPQYVEKRTGEAVGLAQAVRGNTLVNGSADAKDKMLDDGAGKLGSERVDGTPTGRLGNVAEGGLKRRKHPFVDLLGGVTNRKDGLRVFRKGAGNSVRNSTIQEESPAKRARKLLPLPYKKGRNFELPFDVFSPLPSEVIPEDWEKMSMSVPLVPFPCVV